jgi:hypothetical protein
MQVVIEQIPGGYRAKPWTDSVEGATQDEALQKMIALIQRYQDNGARFVEVPLMEPNPAEAAWQRLAGWLKDDPDYDDLQASIEERRRQLDDDPDAF